MSSVLVRTFAVLIGVCSAVSSAQASSDQYRFERFWPVLQQPWYFSAQSAAVDDQGFIYVSDAAIEQVQKFTLQGQYVTQWGRRGTGPGEFDNPAGIAVDSDGNVFVADLRNGRIQKFTSNGEFLTAFGATGSAPGQLQSPRYLAIDALDNLFVGEQGNHRVSRFSRVPGSGPSKPPVFDFSFGSFGTGPGQFTGIGHMALFENGDIFVVGSRTDRVQKFSPQGDFILEFGSQGQGPGELNFPGGIAINNQDEVLVADSENRIQAFDLNGNFLREMGDIRPPGAIPLSADVIAITGSGELILTDRNRASVAKTTAEGGFLVDFGSTGSTPGRFIFAGSIAQDPLGRLFVADAPGLGPGGRYQAFGTNGELLLDFDLDQNLRDITFGEDGRLYGVRGGVFVYESLAAGASPPPPNLLSSATDSISNIPFGLVGNLGSDQLLFNIAINPAVNTPVSEPLAGNNQTRALGFADLNGDRRGDYIYGVQGVNQIEINDFPNIGGATDPLSTDADDTRAIVVFDADGNGTMDILTGNADAPNRLFLNDGSGSFFLGTTLGDAGDDSRALTTADIDGNGTIDVFVGNADGQSRIYLNDGAAGFSPGPVIGSPSDSILAARFVDLDRSGTFDLVVARDGTNQVYLNANGVFAAPTNITTDNHDSRSLDLADLNRDGYTDIMVGNYNQINRYYLNAGDGVSWIGSDIGAESEATTSLAVFADTTQALLYVGNDGQLNRVYYTPQFEFEALLTASAQIPEEGASNTQAVLLDDMAQSVFGQVNATVVGISPGDHLYALNPSSQTVTRFDSDATPMAETRVEQLPGEAAVVLAGMAVDQGDRIYVTDRYNQRIHRLDPPTDLSGNDPHTLAFTFGDPGTGDGQLDGPRAIEVLSNGNLLVADEQARLQIFTSDGQFVSSFGEQGLTPGTFELIADFEALDDGRVAVLDTRLDRVQVFTPQSVADNTKAIVVAGGGPYTGNSLWDATQNNANFAYRVLVSQGFTKDTIWYLSADTGLDLDGNGEPDDVDADASIANLTDAFTNFAADADNLVVYLVDHGGLDTFRMSGTETLPSGVLGTLMDSWQSANPTAKLTAIYDACQAGSFLEELSSDQFDRAVIASSGPTENAYFVSQGSLSFSNQFWTHIFNGLSLEDAFDLAAQAQTTAFPLQTPMVEADGDGMANTPLDLARLNNQFIGNGTQIFGNAPQIGELTVSPPNGSTATVEVAGVNDDDGIARVWMVLRPPGFNPGSPDNPIQDLPTVELTSVAGTQNYSATFSGFTSEGSYQITVYAQDAIGNTAVPVVGALTVSNPLQRKAIIVAAGESSDPLAGAIATNANLAYSALLQQGYGPDGGSCASALCDDVQFLSNSGVAGLDAAATLANLHFAITDWAIQDGQDLVVYLVGTPEASGLRLNAGEVLSVSELAAWLDLAQQTLPGAVVVLYDGEFSGDFVQGLAPPTGNQRVTIASDGDLLRCNLVLDDDISFSRYFWGQILNGATVRQAFNVARLGIRYSDRSQVPLLDDNGNGIGNEFTDGIFSRTYALGSGVLLAGDEPLVAAVNAPATITGAELAEIEAIGVTSTGTIDSVEAVITLPTCEEIRLPMQNAGESRFVVQTQALADVTGLYDVAVIARDDEGLSSLPVVTRIEQLAGGLLFSDGFEGE